MAAMHTGRSKEQCCNNERSKVEPEITHYHKDKRISIAPEIVMSDDKGSEMLLGRPWMVLAVHPSNVVAAYWMMTAWRTTRETIMRAYDRMIRISLEVKDIRGWALRSLGWADLSLKAEESFDIQDPRTHRGSDMVAERWRRSASRW